MEEIKQLLKDNPTLKAMLLKTDNEAFKTGALTQLKLDTGHTMDFIYSNYYNILNEAKCI